MDYDYEILSSKLHFDYQVILDKLSNFDDGHFSCGRGRGWIIIERAKKGGRDVMWLSDKDNHYPLKSDRPAICGTFLPDKIHFICESALTMHPVYKDEKRLKVAIRLCNDIEHAYFVATAPITPPNPIFQIIKNVFGFSQTKEAV